MKSLCRWPTGSRFMKLQVLMLFCLFTALGFAQDKQEITLDPQVLQQYVGVYELAPNFNLTIALDGNQLMEQASGQGKLPIYASSPTKFFLKAVDARIEFFKNDAGAVSHLMLYQNGREIKGVKTSDKVVERKAVAVSPEILAQYAGVYEIQPGFDLAITLENGQLMSQATGQSKVPIYAESETSFFLKVVDAKIDFAKDDKGAVTHLILTQGPNNVKAPRKK